MAGAGLGKLQTGARNEGRSDPVTYGVQTALSPLTMGLGQLANGTSDLAAGLFSGGALRASNRRLTERAAAASLYEQNVKLLLADNARLRKLLELPPTPGRKRVASTVIGYFPLENRISLSVGADQGIKEGMPVIDADGLVGKVQTVDAKTSQALLITSPRLRIGAMVQREPPPAGIVIGESPRSLLLDYLDMQATVQVGDLVVTSGYSDRVPPGIPIGRVAQLYPDPANGSLRCQVFPNVQVGSLRDVYVLK